MKKLFIIIFALFVGIAYADNVITSKEYVDTAGVALQPQIQAKNTNTVLTYPAAGTDTPGEKAIYDASAAYGEQTDALVTAGDFNNALQTALDTEFVCVSRNDQGCLLYEIRAATPKSASKNLFNKNTITEGKRADIASNGALIKGSSFAVSDYIPVTPGETYTITNVRPGNSFANGVFYYDQNKVFQRGHGCSGLKCYATPGEGEVYIRFNLLLSQKDVVQMERGTTATEYEPYENLYLPGAN